MKFVKDLIKEKNMSKLDNIEKIKQLDPDNMYHKIIKIPEQILKAYFEPQLKTPKGFSDLQLNKINKVVICGMGGSAISGDIARSAFGTKIPFEVVKDYHIPYLDENTLVVVLSYSGNTEETLSCLQQALQSTKFIGVITSGGKVKQLIDEDHCWLELPSGLPPRSAIGYLFFSLMKILEIFNIIPDHTKQVRSVIANLVKKAGAIADSVPEEMNIAKFAAGKIEGKIPIIYTSNPQLAPLGYRWKCQFNENAKYPAFHHTFPEMNHNEIEGWEADDFKEKFIPIILSKFKEASKYQKRINAFRDILRRSDIDFLEYYAEGSSLVEEIFSLIYLGDMVSFYLGILRGVNPTSIEFIDYLKKKIQ